MDVDYLLPFSTRQELRAWLAENSAQKKYCWIAVSMKPAKNTIYYLDAVEECLCYGWIDNTRKKLPDGILAQRLAPRVPGSKWSELNKERVRRLEKLGLMTEQGRRCLPEMSPTAFVIDEEIMAALRSDPQLYANFLEFPELYRRVRIDTIRIKKVQPALFQSRLNKFLEATKMKKMYGNWHDQGRLLDY